MYCDTIYYVVVEVIHYLIKKTIDLNILPLLKFSDNQNHYRLHVMFSLWAVDRILILVFQLVGKYRAVCLSLFS